MKPVEFLGLAILAAVVSLSKGGWLYDAICWVMFGLWMVASFKAHRREVAQQ